VPEKSAALVNAVTSPVVGRESERSSRRDAVLEGDAIAVQLRRALDRVALPLARAASAFVVHRGWVPFGHARLEDHSRERFDRSSRWVRDLAALGSVLATMPALGEALVGSDGGRPIGRVAALVVARVASSQSVGSWIDLARSVTVRELKAAASKARDAQSCWPPPREDQPRPGSSNLDLDALNNEDDQANRLVRFLVPELVRAAFDETLTLHRAVSGQEVTVTSFVEALVAEGFAGPSPPDADSIALRPAPDEAAVEEALARATRNWADLEESPDESIAVAAACLRRLESCFEHAGRGGPAELDLQLRTLIGLEDEVERHLGTVMRDLSERGGWSRLMFRGAGHYAEQRLGLARRTAQNRAMLSRALRRFPRLRAAYERGDVGLEAALLVVRMLRSAPAVDRATEEAWVERARECTVKRLRDERRAHARNRYEGSDPLAASSPLPDDAWHASLRLAPGTQRRRVLRLGLLAAEQGCADVFLRLRLPDDLAASFLAVAESATRRLEQEVERIPWDQPDPDPVALPSWRAARTFSIRCRRVPVWVGLLAMLEDYVLTWDDPQGMPKRAADRIYIRDGWRCTAPGCTSRRNLEDHHLDYRSHGGINDPSNRTTLCRFHHQMGEHGLMAACRGAAPLGILWSMGRDGVGGRYRNERVV
jgi:hypothetical protein